MTTATTKKTEVNYTDEMVAKLHAAAPIDYAKAQALALEMGKGVRSIIAKVKREEIEYISKPAPAKSAGPKGATKTQMVAAVEAAVGGEEGDLVGLEKSTGNALKKLITLMRG